MAGEGFLDPLEAAISLFEGRDVLVALSGGPDSALAAWLAHQYARSARAVFVDHQWEDSAAMRRAAESVARTIGIDLKALTVVCPPGSSPELQARIARYEALDDERADGEVIVTGHTSNDHAETVLFHLTRGSGARGLSGIPGERQAILRPLLSVSRPEIEAAAHGLDIPIHHDPANVSEKYARVRVRKILPGLLDAVGVEDHSGISRSAELARRDDDELSRLAREVPLRFSPFSVSAATAYLRVLSPAVRSRVFRRMVEYFRPFGAYFAEVERMEELLTGGSITELSGGLMASTTATALTVATEVALWDELTWESDEVNVPGGWTMSRFLSSQTPPALPVGTGLAVFDFDALPGDLTIVPASQAHAIGTPGGTKRIRDCLSEASVAHHLRDLWPVVKAGSEAIWIPGVRRSAVGWISESTQRYLSLHVVREDKWRIRKF